MKDKKVKWEQDHDMIIAFNDNKQEYEEIVTCKKPEYAQGIIERVNGWDELNKENEFNKTFVGKLGVENVKLTEQVEKLKTDLKVDESDKIILMDTVVTLKKALKDCSDEMDVYLEDLQIDGEVDNYEYAMNHAKEILK